MIDERAIVLERIRTCDADPDDEDKATPYAKALAVALLCECSPLPRASAGVFEGDLHLYWRLSGTRKMHVMAPKSAERQPYIYHEEGGDYGIERPATPARVAEWLRWYCGEERPL